MSKKISEQPNVPGGTVFDGSEVAVFNKGGITYKETFSALLAWLALPFTSLGDLVVGGASGAKTRLAIGANGTVLTAVGGTAAWATPNQFEDAVALGSGSAINVTLSGLYYKTITANTAFTVTDVPATGKFATFILELVNPGAFTTTFWSGITWNAGAPPTLTVSGRDVLAFYTHDGGTTWTGMVLGQAFA